MTFVQITDEKNLMPKRTVSQLAIFLSELTGLPESTHQQIARRAREGGYLSQAGRGRGAAAATPEDAAMMLLISLCETSARYADVLAAALLATKPDRSRAETLQATGNNAVEAIADLIRHNIPLNRVDVVTGSGLFVTIMGPEPENAVITYGLPRNARELERLLRVIDRKPVKGVGHVSTIEPWVFDEISGFLGPEN